ncbi:MAG: hypothetical protein QGF03_09075 [SAR324 cluster bacterium]|nr:hypothetical protein [SAR324 cluster bacterium]
MKVDNVGPKRIPTVERAFGEAKQVTVERAPRRSEAGGEVWEAHRAQRVEAVQTAVRATEQPGGQWKRTASLACVGRREGEWKRI